MHALDGCKFYFIHGFTAVRSFRTGSHVERKNLPCLFPQIWTDDGDRHPMTHDQTSPGTAMGLMKIHKMITSHIDQMAILRSGKREEEPGKTSTSSARLESVESACNEV